MPPSPNNGGGLWQEKRGKMRRKEVGSADDL